MFYKIHNMIYKTYHMGTLLAVDPVQFPGALSGGIVVLDHLALRYRIVQRSLGVAVHAEDDTPRQALVALLHDLLVDAAPGRDNASLIPDLHPILA